MTPKPYNNIAPKRYRAPCHERHMFGRDRTRVKVTVRVRSLPLSLFLSSVARPVKLSIAFLPSRQRGRGGAERIEQRIWHGSLSVSGQVRTGARFRRKKMVPKMVPKIVLRCNFYFQTYTNYQNCPEIYPWICPSELRRGSQY